MRSIAFDGQILCHRRAGLYRYANEILLELDSIIEKDEFTLVIPEYADYDNRFCNLNVVRYGGTKGILWTQISFMKYCKKNGYIPFGFANTTPLLYPGIVVLHDLSYKVMKHTYRNMYGRIASLWYRLNYWCIAKNNYPIITVSQTSKNEICKEYNVNEERITVVGNGWQHFERISEDESISDRYPRIKNIQFYYTLGSMDERKNLKWIKEVSKRHPDELFVIAGKMAQNARKKSIPINQDNLLLLGFVTDEESKWLMSHCKAFLFPSLYEGFGIPPMEALSVGAKIIVSNRSCLPEIYENCAYYIDPYEYDVDLGSLLETKMDTNGNDVLNKYSWANSAQQLLLFLKRIKKETISKP